MRVEPVDVDDERAMREWYAVTAAARDADSPGLPVLTFPEVLERARQDGGDERQAFWLGRRSGTAVGCYRLSCPVRDNLDTAALQLAVHPRHRHRGYGRALVSHMLDQVRRAGRHRVLVEVVEQVGDDPGRGAAVASAAGFRRALVQARRVLDLTDLTTPAGRARLSVLEQAAWPHAGGYELVGWSGPAPDEHVAGYAALIGRMSTDAPLDDLDLEPEVWDVDRVRRRDALVAAQGRTVLVTAARHLASGELVAFSDLAVTRHDPDNAFQWDTLVRRDHRGHRLGLLVKVANLRRLLAEAPSARRVHTWNADSNAAMVAINETMGFRLAEREVEWQLDLPSTPI